MLTMVDSPTLGVPVLAGTAPELAALKPFAVANEARAAALRAHLLATANAHTIAAIVGLVTALAAKAPLDSPALTGTPTSTTPPTSDNSTRVATTAHVAARFDALIGGAPGTADTLAEIAALLAADGSALAALTSAIAGKQPLDSDLTAIAALATTTFGRSLLTKADAAAVRAALDVDESGGGTGNGDVEHSAVDHAEVYDLRAYRTVSSRLSISAPSTEFYAIAFGTGTGARNVGWIEIRGSIYNLTQNLTNFIRCRFFVVCDGVTVHVVTDEYVADTRYPTGLGTSPFGGVSTDTTTVPGTLSLRIVQGTYDNSNWSYVVKHKFEPAGQGPPPIDDGGGDY